jgi:hypothetical protein
MCGCGCELGLVLASCQAVEVQRSAARGASSPTAQLRRTILERVMLAWLASVLGDAALHCPIAQNDRRGSGR